MKKIIVGIAFLFFTLPVFAGPASVVGGKPLNGGTAHNVSLGWPSISYEWWHAGNPDWAIGAELVYGDWSGAFSEVDIGAAINVPFRFHMHHEGRLDVGFTVKPGGMIGTIDTPGDNITVAALRAEMGVPMTVELDDRINLITGAVVPFTMMFVENADDFAVIPILARLGVEVAASQTISPFLLIEVGPTFRAGGGGGDHVDFGARAWVGATFF